MAYVAIAAFFLASSRTALRKESREPDAHFEEYAGRRLCNAHDYSIDYVVDMLNKEDQCLNKEGL